MDRPAGEDHVQGAAEADDAGEALGAAVDQGDAEAPLEAAEDGGHVRDPEVAPAGDLQPAGHAVAGDGRDRGLGDGQAGEAQRA